MTTDRKSKLASENESGQLTLLGITQAVGRVLDAKLSEPKTLRDPRQKLAKYPERMRVDQVAAYLNCDEKHIRNLYESGALDGEDIAAAPGQTRRCLRIYRDSVAQFETTRKNIQ